MTAAVVRKLNTLTPQRERRVCQDGKVVLRQSNAAVLLCAFDWMPGIKHADFLVTLDPLQQLLRQHLAPLH
jgi:hypothetical protein